MSAIWTIYKGIKPEKLEAKRADLASRGIPVTGDSGALTHELPIGEVKVDYEYTGKVLRVSIVECPWVDRARVRDLIYSWLEV